MISGMNGVIGGSGSSVEYDERCDLSLSLVERDKANGQRALRVGGNDDENSMENEGPRYWVPSLVMQPKKDLMRRLRLNVWSLVSGVGVMVRV